MVKKSIGGMIWLILLSVGNILVKTNGFSLNCTNDFDKLMSCYIDAHNCAELSLSFQHPTIKRTCAFDSCAWGCCCSVELILEYGDEYEANVWKNGQSVHKETINVYETIKPKTPFIDPKVFQSNGIYQIQWRTNANKFIRYILSAIVTYHKKGDLKKISTEETPSQNEDRNDWQILGQTLEPNTTYVVSVRTYTPSGVFSDSSNEVEFTTNLPKRDGLLAVILGLSIGAVVISSLAFVFVVKLKGKLWDDAAKDEKPKLLEIQTHKELVLTPESLLMNSVSVEQLIPKEHLTGSKESLSDTSGTSGQTSGVSMASSLLEYPDTKPDDIAKSVMEALKKAFPSFAPVEDTYPSDGPAQSGTTPPPLEKLSFPRAFQNRVYFGGAGDATEDAQAASDSGYHLSHCPTLHYLAAAPAMETDMSYQPCTQSGGATRDSQNPLAAGDEDRDCDKHSQLSSDMSLEVFHCAPHGPNDMPVDLGYHCV